MKLAVSLVAFASVNLAGGLFFGLRTGDWQIPFVITGATSFTAGLLVLKHARQ